jgi:UDP-N-acetylenolpyruvoylglucosamine reductase
MKIISVSFKIFRQFCDKIGKCNVLFGAYCYPKVTRKVEEIARPLPKKMQALMREREAPEEWRTANAMSIFKKGPNWIWEITG